MGKRMDQHGLRKANLFMDSESEESEANVMSNSDDIRFRRISMNENNLNHFYENNICSESKAGRNPMNIPVLDQRRDMKPGQKDGSAVYNEGRKNLNENRMGDYRINLNERLNLIDGNKSCGYGESVGRGNNNGSFFDPNKQKMGSGKKGEFAAFPIGADCKMQKLKFEPLLGKTRNRTTPDQLMALETVCKTTMRPNKEIRLKLADELRMNQRQVQIWFQNKRAKLKKMIEITKPGDYRSGHMPNESRGGLYQNEYRSLRGTGESRGYQNESSSVSSSKSEYATESSMKADAYYQNKQYPASPIAYSAAMQQPNSAYLRNYCGLPNRYPRGCENSAMFNDIKSQELAQYYSEPFENSPLKTQNFTRPPAGGPVGNSQHSSKSDYDDDEDSDMNYGKNRRDGSVYRGHLNTRGQNYGNYNGRSF